MSRIGSLLLWMTLTLLAGPSFAQENKLDPLRRAAKAAPSDVDAAISLGRALRRAGRYSDALTELRRGQNLPQARMGDSAVRVRYELARVFIDDRKFQEALAACRSVGAVAGGEALGHACAGAAHMMRKRATEALPEAQLALDSAPSLYEAKIVVADALALEGSPVKAEESLKDAMAGDPKRPEAYLRLGELYDLQSKHEAALEMFNRARAADPDDADAAAAVGRSLPKDQRAAEALEAAVASRPPLGMAWARLAEVKLALGNLPEAERAATMALGLDSKQADWHAVLARVYAAERRYDDALRETRASLAIVGNLASAKLTEADVLAMKGEIDFALEAYQTAFGFARSDPTALVHAALACLDAGRATSAKGFADRATQLFPKWGPGWVVLGDVLANDKENTAARQAYRSALAAEGPVDRSEVERKIGLLK